jgi:hypothetical protein
MWLISPAVVAISVGLIGAYDTEPTPTPSILVPRNLEIDPIIPLSKETISHYLTMTDDLFEEWRIQFALHEEFFDLTDPSVNDAKDVVQTMIHYFYGSDFSTILARYESRMGSVVHGGNHMKPAVVRSLLVLSILSDLGNFDAIHIPMFLGFSMRGLTQKQIETAFSLTFRMHVGSEESIIKPLRIIMREEDLSDADLLPLIELISDICANQQSQWFMTLFESHRLPRP